MLTLEQIVSTDPDGIGYATMTDAEIADDIKALRKTTRARVDFDTYQQFLFDNGVVLNVMMAINDVNHAGHGVAVLVDQMLKFGAERLTSGVDMDSVGNDAIFDQMIAAGLMTAEVRTAMEALADHPASLQSLNELGAFSHLDVAKITGGSN